MLEVRLAGTAIPGLITWNPKIDVFAVILTNGRAVLFRFGGEQVWQAPLRRVSTPTRCSWTPDGRLLTIVFSDGKTQTLFETQGRQALTSRNDSNVSCVAWGREPDTQVASPNGVTEETAFGAILGDITKILPRLSVTDAPVSALMLLGTQHGQLRVHLYSSVCLEDISLAEITEDAVAEAPVTQIMVSGKESRYAAVAGQSLVQFRAGYLEVHGHTGMEARVLAAARASSLASELTRGRTRLRTTFAQLQAAHTRYFGEAGGGATTADETGNNGISQMALLRALVAGHSNHGLAEWLDMEHESGLRIWVSATEQAYSAIERLHTELFLPATQQLALHLARMESLALNQGEHALWNNKELASLSSKVHELLEQLHEEKKVLAHETMCCYALAHFLQRKLASRLDRRVNLATRGQLDTHDAAEYIMQWLSNPARDLSNKLSDELTKFESSLAVAGDNARTVLRSMVKLDWTAKIPGTDAQICIMDETSRRKDAASGYHTQQAAAEQRKLANPDSLRTTEKDACHYTILYRDPSTGNFETVLVVNGAIQPPTRLGSASEARLTPNGKTAVLLQLGGRVSVHEVSSGETVEARTSAVPAGSHSLAVGDHYACVLGADRQTVTIFAIDEPPLLARAIATPRPLERETELRQQPR